MLNPETAPATMDTLERLMDAAWPALESSTADGWVLRSAGGVTQRANSIWPAAETSDQAASLRHAEDWYARHRQPVIFQLTRRPENAALEDYLDGRSYSRQSETIIMAGTPSQAASPAPDGITVTLADAPSSGWLDLWWSVDGRGGDAEKRLALDILAGAPSIYATALNGAGDAVGTGRLTLVDGWGGVYGMATHPEFRRQGVAAAVLATLLENAVGAGIENVWLMVTNANAGAQKLYSNAGFAEVGRYHYRQAPLRRAPGAC